LGISDLVCLFNATRSFIENCESICKRHTLSLRGTIATQTSEFIDAFHHKRISVVSLILENEKWSQVEVASEFQQLVDSLTRSDDDNNDKSSNNQIESTTQPLGLFVCLFVCF
jgi:hypothetical protein